MTPFAIVSVRSALFLTTSMSPVIALPRDRDRDVGARDPQVSERAAGGQVDRDGAGADAHGLEHRARRSC